MVTTIPQSERDPAKIVFTLRQLTERDSARHEVLSADRTYYVSTVGNDHNSGMDSTSASAFRTIQKAIDTAYSLDFNGHVVTIQLAAGTYSEDLFIFGPIIGWDPGLQIVAPLKIVGDTTTPANVVISSTGDCFEVAYGAVVDISGVKLTSSAGSGFNVSNGGNLFYHLMEFGACQINHVSVVALASASCTGNIRISGNSNSYAACYQVAQLNHFTPCEITIVGTVTFGRSFVHGEGIAFVGLEQTTYVNAAGVVGKKFDGVAGTVFAPTVGANLSAFPGDAPGILDDTSTYLQINQFSSFNKGTISSGTVTPDPGVNVSNQPAVRRWYYTNNGAHSVAAPPLDGKFDLLITNSTSAGAITFSGFTVKAAPGDALTTTNGNKFLVEIFTINAVSTYRVYALQ